MEIVWKCVMKKGYIYCGDFGQKNDWLRYY